MRTQALWKCLQMVVGTRRVGCGFFNVYQSKHNSPKTIHQPYTPVKHNSKTSPYSRAQKGSGFGQDRARQVDTRCRHCNARVRFQLSTERGDSRGRPRRVSVVLEKPRRLNGKVINQSKSVKMDDWTLQELIDECNHLNRGEQQERDKIGFVRAKNYREV